MLKIKLKTKQFLKAILYYILIPLMYSRYKGNRIDKEIVLFADAHNDMIPFSMKLLYDKMKNLNFTVIDHCHDFRNNGLFKNLNFIRAFIKDYVRAKYVFIQDTFLPIAACSKKTDTIVVQLWHGCGLLKKIGFDLINTQSKIMPLNPYKNYDLVTVSSKECIPVFQKAMNLKSGTAQAIGVSRTDYYFDRKFKEQCMKEFLKLNPDAKGKKLVIWAPTFREDAATPKIDFIDEVIDCLAVLPNEYFPIVKLHPHLKESTKYDSKILIEQLLPITDIFITDYSSILFEYLLQYCAKKLILYAPDLDRYRSERGLYIPYDSIPGIHTKTVKELQDAIIKSRPLRHSEIDVFLEKYVDACKGESTRIILNFLKIT